jgi:hypothetical protein
MRTGEALGLTVEQVAGDWQLVAYLDSDGLDTYQRMTGYVGWRDESLPFDEAEPMRIPLLAGDMAYLKESAAADEMAQPSRCPPKSIRWSAKLSCSCLS